VSRIIYSHDLPDRFIVGTVGVPGEREFFIQVSSPIGVTTIGVEKSQVAALVERLQLLLRELRKQRLVSDDQLAEIPPPESGGMIFPIEEDFRAGVIGIHWERDRSRVLVEFQEFAEDVLESILSDDEVAERELAPDLLRVYLEIPMVRAFMKLAENVVAAGRQPCLFCGLPINVDGHLCPRANGYKR
jgi:uncharacterized repeat protein (TIGR03847 family)